MIVVFNLALFSCLKYRIYTPAGCTSSSYVLIACAALAEMKLLSITLALGLLAGVWAQLNVLRPLCDSPEAEEAALVAQDYLNGQHAHGYKYVLNRIEDIKIYTRPDGDNTYLLEVDLLETDCHVLDPTPLANCTVRPKALTAVEGDCDVVLKKVGGALTVTAFKCKTEESTEDLCLGCPTLLPLNDTMALNFVQASLVTINNNTAGAKFALKEVGRMSSQIVSGGPIYLTEYVVVEAQCTGDVCEPLNDTMASHGFCTASGLSNDHSVNCKMFLPPVPPVDANGTGPAVPVELPVFQIHKDSPSPKLGLSHHKLTALHDPHLSGLLNSESAESAEGVPVAPAVVDAGAAAAPAADPAAPAADPAAPAADPAAPAADPAAPAADPAAADPAAADPALLVDSKSASDSVSAEVTRLVVKRDVPLAPADMPSVLVEPINLIPVCPGRVRFF